MLIPILLIRSSGDFFWLSAPKPIVPPGTPFPAGFSDVQAWIRNEDLVPDWLRVGTDTAGEPRANVQRHVLAGRPDRPRDHQPDHVHLWERLAY
jgi:hypothetical protein